MPDKRWYEGNVEDIIVDRVIYYYGDAWNLPGYYVTLKHKDLESYYQCYIGAKKEDELVGERKE